MGSFTTGILKEMDQPEPTRTAHRCASGHLCHTGALGCISALCAAGILASEPAFRVAPQTPKYSISSSGVGFIKRSACMPEPVFVLVLIMRSVCACLFRNRHRETIPRHHLLCRRYPSPISLFVLVVVVARIPTCAKSMIKLHHVCACEVVCVRIQR